MSEFLEASACKGRRPDRVAIRRLVPRPDLIARLLRERHVARFLVAPDGFGKTTLACEYADTVFSFEHVFWVNGRSPCFLRDLDRGIIATRLCSLDPSSFLVVFEDVPRLDSARAERFSRVIDDVLEAGDEVLVTCVPSCDAHRRQATRSAGGSGPFARPWLSPGGTSLHSASESSRSAASSLVRSRWLPA